MPLECSFPVLCHCSKDFGMRPGRMSMLALFPVYFFPLSLLFEGGSVTTKKAEKRSWGYFFCCRSRYDVNLVFASLWWCVPTGCCCHAFDISLARTSSLIRPYVLVAIVHTSYYAEGTGGFRTVI